MISKFFIYLILNYFGNKTQLNLFEDKPADCCIFLTLKSLRTGAITCSKSLESVCRNGVCLQGYVLKKTNHCSQYITKKTRELYDVDIFVIKSGRLLKMPISEYINAAAWNCTSSSVLFSFTVGDSGESEERLMSLSLCMCFQRWGECLEIRERNNNCRGVLFSHHNLRLDNVFKKKYWGVFNSFL